MTSTDTTISDIVVGMQNIERTNLPPLLPTGMAASFVAGTWAPEGIATYPFSFTSDPTMIMVPKTNLNSRSVANQGAGLQTVMWTIPRIFVVGRSNVNDEESLMALASAIIKPYYTIMKKRGALTLNGLVNRVEFGSLAFGEFNFNEGPSFGINFTIKTYQYVNIQIDA